jgi:GT2 family glycosyltransferase
MTAPGPYRVAVVDLDEPLEDLGCIRFGGPPYKGAWILACRSGRPLGIAEMPLLGITIPAPELERELRRQLGPAWWPESAAAAPPAAPTGVRLPPISVVIPSTLQRVDGIRSCLDSVAALDYPDFEVIVVDNRRAGSVPVELEGARVVREPRPGISAARNRGLEAADGAIVAFTDDDVIVDPEWLLAIALRFTREPELAAVTGLVVPRELETPAQIWFEQSGSGLDRSFEPLTFERAGRFGLLRRSGHSGDQSLQSLYATGELGLGSNMAFRASVLRASGGFDEALGAGTPTHGGEDLAMLMELLTAGHRVAYEPAAIVHHTHRRTFAELERQIKGYGIGFTAMLTAIAVRDPQHLLGLALVIPAWLRSLRDPHSAKHEHRDAGYPRTLARAELRGMLSGPFAYARSRRAQRRWSR